MRRHEILVINANCLLLKLYARALSLSGYGVTSLPSPTAGIEALRTDVFDLLVSDEDLGDKDDVITVLRKARELQPEMKIMIAMDYCSRGRAPVFHAMGITSECLLWKPGSIDELTERVRALLGDTGGETGVKEDGATEPQRDEVSIPALPVLLHDIRSPLLCIGAHLKLLQRGRHGELPGELRPAIDKVAEKCTLLTRMAEEYLQAITHDDRNKQQAPSESLNLIEEVIDPVVGELAEEMQENGFIFANHIERNLCSGKRILINGGKVWLKSVFRNLLGNAIKYGEKGGTIGIDIEKKANHYQVNVFNSVSAINENAGGHAFVTGDQGCADPGIKTGKRGMGVGLHLTRSIINNYGGEIWQELAGNGTKFVFTLPYEEHAVTQVN